MRPRSRQRDRGFCCRVEHDPEKACPYLIRGGYRLFGNKDTRPTCLSELENVPADSAAPQLTSGPPVVALSGVGKTFANGVVALDRLDLDVRPGELVSLLGPSGCGKSTALRIIAGLSEPSRGKIEWQPADAASAANSRRIGFVFQEPTLMPWATVAANVRLPLTLAGLGRESQARVDAALERVGLAGFAQSYPRELSGGMKMRTSIARALVTEPTLLLMDEPFAALDEITRFRLNNDLLALWQTLGKTVVFVTHSVFESVYLSQRVVVMTPRPGRVFTEMTIGAPYPRDERFRTSADYAGYCRKVSEALASAMGEGP
jgi:NitT/TauT family transport system ATP-binding protein